MTSIQVPADTTVPAPATVAAVETVRYFYFITTRFSRKLPSPIETIKHFDGGFSRQVIEFATNESFNAGTFDLPASEKVTKFGLLTKAMEVALDNANKDRRANDETLLFRSQDMLVTAFDAGRDAL